MPDDASAAMVRAFPSPDRLDALFAVLLQNQFMATPRQRAAAAFILAQHVAGAGADDQSALKHALCPIFADSAARQSAFHRLFDRWAKPGVAPEILGDARALATKAIADRAAAERTSRRRFVATVAAVIFMAAAAVAALSADWRTVRDWLFPPPPPPIVERIDARPVPAAKPGEAFDLPPEFITINRRIVSPFAAPLAWALTLLWPALLGLWLAGRWRRRLLWMDHAAAIDVLDDAGVVIPELQDHLFPEGAFHAIARNLHGRREIATGRLAIPPTVAATAAAAGYFTPVYQTERVSGGYLFLIEQRGIHDHMARLIDEAVARLRERHILIDCYYFRSDPRASWKDDEARTPASLRELAHQFGKNHFVVFATADGFFHPVSGDLHRWFDTFASWPSRALLNARPLEQWSDYELKLLQAGFSLAVADRKGLAAYGEGVASGAIEGRGILLQGRIISEGAPPEPAGHQPAVAPPEVLAPFTVFRDAPGAPELVVVPAGSFMMGSPEDEPERFEDEGPLHKVTIARPFAVGRYAVTRGQFAVFVNATGYKAEGAHTWTGSEWKLDPQASWRAPGFAQDDDHPVVGVSWDDATAYVGWLAAVTGKPYRLLSEAEWEYAARAGTVTPFWWGASITPDQANYDGNSTYAGGAKSEYRGRTMPVDSFSPNPWGLYQVHGNVWEWTQDCWNGSYQDAPSDGSAWTTGDCSRRVLRGGAWNGNLRVLRAAFRDWVTTDIRNSIVGLRVARTLTP